MSECNKLDLTLILKPIKTQVSTGANNDWLENNDANLLNTFSHTQTANPELRAMVEKIAVVNNQQRKTYHVEIIQIKQQIDNFLLLSENQWRCLENGDVILADFTPLEVEIQKKQIVINPDPNLAAVEMLASTSADFWEVPNLRTDASAFPAQTSVQDPLTFLFGKQMPEATQPMSTLIPQTSGVGAMPYDPIAVLQSPMPALSISHSQISSLSTKTMDVTRHTPSSNNILHELGIADSSACLSSMPRADYMAKKSFAEQAPLDCLDEFLSDSLQESFIHKY